MRISKRYAAAALAGILCLMSAQPALGAGPQETSRWEQNESGQWYYYDAAGNQCTGWQHIGGSDYYLYEDGHCAISEVTPDGFRVDENGARYEVRRQILGQSFSVPGRFVTSSQSGENWGTARDGLEKLNTALTQAFGGGRKLAVDVDSVEYLSTKNKTRYMGLYKDYESGGYRLELRTKLDRTSTDTGQAATWDYGVFQALVTAVSSTPEQLEEAIYSAWQEQNIYGISRTQSVTVGDCQVMYESGQGTGRFYIRPPQ